MAKGQKKVRVVDVILILFSEFFFCYVISLLRITQSKVP